MFLYLSIVHYGYVTFCRPPQRVLEVHPLCDPRYEIGDTLGEVSFEKDAMVAADRYSLLETVTLVLCNLAPNIEQEQPSHRNVQ